MSLSSIYVDYIDSIAEPFERKPNRLYVTDVGACPRSVMYRLLDTEKDPQSEQSIVNDKMMFDLAEHIETMLTTALEKNGMLIDQQLSVPIDDRDNWGGRIDIAADYNGRRIIEVKTMRSNAFNYSSDLPKGSHSYQASIYDHYMTDVLELDSPPMLWYADRGGANTPLEFYVDNWEEAEPLMDALDEHRSSLPALPDKLPKVLKLRTYGKEVKEEPDFRCSYCPYQGTCKPDMSVRRMAYLKDGVWRVTKAGNIDDLVNFGVEVTR